MSITSLGSGMLVGLIGLAALASTTCSSLSPTAPTATTGVGGGSNGGRTASVRIDVSPNPVPFSGTPITDTSACTNRNNTWFYDQNVSETAGVEATFTSRIDSFDGVIVNDLKGLTITIPAGGMTTLKTRWCSATAAEHRAQTILGGTDANGHGLTVTSAVVVLLAPKK